MDVHTPDPTFDRDGLFKSGPEPAFDEITTLAAILCATPMAVISLLDEQRQWFKSRVGVAVEGTPRGIAFCGLTVERMALTIISDARMHPRFAGNPLVTGPPYIRFYAGAPLVMSDGTAIGSLAVLDTVPRTLGAEQQQALEVLSRQVVAQIELRSHVHCLANVLRDLSRSKELLRLSHRELELRVSERTSELIEVNARLASEIDRHSSQARSSQAIIDSLPGIFYLYDRMGRFLRWNRNFELVTGYTAEEIRQLQPLDFFATQQEKELVDQRIVRAFMHGSASVEADLLTKGGKRIPYLFTGIRIEFNGQQCISGMAVDITERRSAEESLRLRNRAIQASVNAIIITDLEGNIEYANPAFERITGYSIRETLGRNCRFLQAGDRDQAGIAAIRQAIANREESSALMRNYRKDGEMFWNDVHIAPVRDQHDEVTHFVGVLNDISAIKHYEYELERHAKVDALTALANRNVLKDRIRQGIATAERHREWVAVGFMDLDNFKFINDSLGHTVGDELLKQVAKRLQACLREQDTVARYGGDEFAFVISGEQEEKTVATLMSRILRTIELPFLVEGHKLFVSCSIGLSFSPRDGVDVDTLLKNADAAMYQAKEKGRNNFQFYTPAMNQRATERLSLESRLRQALIKNEFVLHYQPKVDLKSGRIVGLEALLRWQPSSGEMVAPSTFIPLAEETGLIVPIGEWVLYTACAHNRQLLQAGMQPLQVAVNISARQFNAETLVDMVKDALGSTGLDASLLELELTESLVMQNPEEAIGVLAHLKEMGLRLAIDDFGTGYSSLSHLQRFPVDQLKIDQSFVRDIGADPNDAIIARAVISLGHSLGMSVIAEGVSNHEQLAFLRENGCDEMQGFLFSMPLPADELICLLKSNRTLATH